MHRGKKKAKGFITAEPLGTYIAFIPVIMERDIDGLRLGCVHMLLSHCLFFEPVRAPYMVRKNDDVICFRDRSLLYLL